MDNQRSDAFLCRKWSLLTITLLWLIGDLLLVILMAIGSVTTKTTGSGTVRVVFGDDTTIGLIWMPFNDTQTSNKIWNIVLIVSAIISICIQTVGLIGAYKEHKLLSLIHTIIMTLNVIYLFVAAFGFPLYWLYFTYNLIVCVIGFLFVRDLYRTRSEPSAPQSPMTTFPPTYPPYPPKGIP